jgi:D-threo-aldose 1-dehydrogenase
MSNPTIKVQHNLLPVGTMPLGFGCSSLPYGVDRSESLRLLETALDAGITYFDTARMYGFGDAESVLGALAERHRDRIIIASKAGILPASRSLPLRAFNRGVRLLHKAAPQLKKHLTPLRSEPRTGVFDLQDLRKSVETSLKKLRTNYLDVLLLHECTELDIAKEELLYFLEDLRKQGKIRAFGLATGINETIRIIKTRPQLGCITQIASNIWNMNIARLPTGSDRLTIIHSVLTSRFHDLTQRLSEDRSLAAEWRSALQIDPNDKPALAQLLLAHAIRSNPGGMVLFHTTKPENIRAAVRTVTENCIGSHQIDDLEKLLKSGELRLPSEGFHRDYLRVS